MTTTRRLSSEEYVILKNIADGYVPDPSNSIAIIAEENGRIIGRMLLVAMAHIEATWIHPEARGGVVGFRMERAMETEAKMAGINRLLAYSPPPLSHFMQRLGFRKLEYEILEKEI